MDLDPILVARAAAGCRDAFDELVRRYRRPVYGLVRALTGGDSEAEDLVQDTFVRAFRAIAGFRGQSAFRSWLYRIAINVVHTHLARRRIRDAAIVTPPQELWSIEEHPADGDMEKALLRRQVIDRALAELPDDLRILIVLRDVHGLKYDEIARIVKTPRGTVESRLFRARQRLRPLLAPLVVADERVS